MNDERTDKVVYGIAIVGLIVSILTVIAILS